MRDLFEPAWGVSFPHGFAAIFATSAVHVTAWDAGRLIGFVNVVDLGDAHARVFDVTVHPDFQRRGLGATWLHVDFEPRLRPFYERRGFTAAA